MATTALYRINGGEVLKISVQGQSFADRDPVYWGVLTDPTLPDGNQVRTTTNGVLGPLRVLGLAKIALPGSNAVRNATQPELDAFVTADATDESAQDATDATQLFETHPRFRKAFKAMVKRIIAENNLQAAQWNAFRVQVAAATNLSDLKTRVAANTTDMPVRTVAQALTALAADVSAGD